MVADRLRRALPAPWVSVLTLGVVAVGGYFLISSSRAQSFAYDGIGLASVAAFAAAYRWRRPPSRSAWLLLVAGFGCWVAGDLVWTVEFDVLGHQVPTLSHSDLLYFAGYGVLALGLVRIAAGEIDSWLEAAGSMIDALLAAVVAAVLTWAFLVDPAIDRGISFSQELVTAAYPTLDALILVLVVGLVVGAGLRITAAALLAFGLVLQLAGDALWRDVTIYSAYTVGSWINALFLLSYVVCGAAALHPSMVELARRRRPAPSAGLRSRIALMVGATAVIPIVLGAKGSRLAEPGGLVLLGVGVTAISILVCLRALTLVRIADRFSRQAVAERQRMEAVVEASPAAVAFIEPDGRIAMWNEAAERVSGWAAEEVVGSPIETFGSRQPSDAEELIARAMRGERLSDVELRVARRSGEEADIVFSAASVAGPRGEREGTVAFWVDVTQRKRDERLIRHLATHDPITNLPNRRAFEEHLLQAVKRCSTGRRSALLVFDLDNFKLVNDTAGHPAGDRYLEAVATLLADALRPGDFIARLGGDEFGAIVHDVSPEEAFVIGERLVRAAAGFRFHENGHVFDLTISVGLCPIDDGRRDPADIVSLADRAMYRAKTQGKNRIAEAVDDRSELATLSITRRWIARTKDALATDALVLALQPIVELANGRTRYHEVLVRLPGSRPDELALPREFLPSAERFGLMPALDRWVVERALRMLRDDDELSLFVNLSAASFEDDRLLDMIERELGAPWIGRHRLGIEVTETAMFRDRNRAARRIESLKARGCLIALDDFGVGFTSFAELLELPVDFVKIGPPFTSGELGDAERSRAVVKAVVDVARALDKDVIGEAIESEETAAVLRSLGVELGQGFLFGAPERAEVGRVDAADVSLPAA